MNMADSPLRGLLRRWPMILVTVIVAVLAAYAFAQSQADEYRVSTRLLVGPPNDGTVERMRAAGLMAHTYGDLIKGPSSLLAAAEEAGFPRDLDELTELVDVRADETTRVLSIAVQHEDPEAAATFVGALADRIVLTAPPPNAVFDPSVRTLQTEMPAGMVTVIDDASSQVEPVDRPVLLLVVLSGVVAAAIAATAAIGLEVAPWRRPPPNLEGLIHRRFLGRVPLPPSGATARFMKRRRRQEAARDHRLISTKLQHLTASSPLKSLSVFGARSDDGSALVAAELATTFAEDGRSVVLVDLTNDSELARHLDLGRRDREVVTVDDVVLELASVAGGDGGKLEVLVSDAVRVTEQAPKARHVVELLGEVADLVVVVAPPMLLEFGTLLVAKMTDGALLVGTEDSDSVDGVIEAFDVLRANDVSITGTVLASRHAPVDHPSISSAGTPSGAGARGSIRSSDHPSDLAPER